MRGHLQHQVLFDCAGLMVKPETILDKLAQQAAVEALKNSLLILYCVDLSKADFSEDIAIRKLFETEANGKMIINIATKTDTTVAARETMRITRLGNFMRKYKLDE